MQGWDNRNDIYFWPIILQFQHSTKIVTDVWANQVLNALLEVPYHHLIMAIPWHLRIVIKMNRRAGLNLDGKRWIETDPKFLMYHGGLKKRCKYQVTTRMKRAHHEKRTAFRLGMP